LVKTATTDPGTRFPENIHRLGELVASSAGSGSNKSHAALHTQFTGLTQSLEKHGTCQKQNSLSINGLVEVRGSSYVSFSQEPRQSAGLKRTRFYKSRAAVAARLIGGDK
jgi:hypothetical protein